MDQLRFREGVAHYTVTLSQAPVTQLSSTLMHMHLSGRLLSSK